MSRVVFTCKGRLDASAPVTGQPGLTACLLRQLYGRFRAGQEPPKALGPSRDYNVDMVPKFILSGGELVRALGVSIRSHVLVQWACGTEHRRAQDLHAPLPPPSLLPRRAPGARAAQRPAAAAPARLGPGASRCAARRAQVRVLVHTDVVKYLEFKAVDGSFVLNKGRVEKVPATDYEALRSPLMGLFEKRRARSFFMCAPAPAPPGAPCRTNGRPVG